MSTKQKQKVSVFLTRHFCGFCCNEMHQMFFLTLWLHLLEKLFHCIQFFPPDGLLIDSKSNRLVIICFVSSSRLSVNL